MTSGRECVALCAGYDSLFFFACLHACVFIHTPSRKLHTPFRQDSDNNDDGHKVFAFISLSLTLSLLS